ncbi:P-loop containing nucleoside triphosphate hydrolase protein [Phycomyces blakesleeanus]
MPLKIIGAGFGRTGTNSLRLALETLGYRTHHMIKALSDITQDPLVWERAFNDPENHPDEWESVYGNYDAAIDWPTVTHYKELMKKYPDAKIILTTRSAESWYKSMNNTIFMKMHSNYVEELPEHPRLFLKSQQKIMLNGYLKDDLSKSHNKEELCRMFEEHNEEVKRLVPPEKLLVLELGEGWDRLCEFLGVSVPGTPYPNTNSSGEGFEKNAEIVLNELEKQKLDLQKVKAA